MQLLLLVFYHKDSTFSLLDTIAMAMAVAAAEVTTTTTAII